MADLQETIGAVIRQQRRERDLTLKELAARAAVSVVYLGEIERGQKYPSAGVLESVARALDLEIPDLLTLFAEELRAETAVVPTRAVGVALPSRSGAGSRAAMESVLSVEPLQMVAPADLTALFSIQRLELQAA